MKKNKDAWSRAWSGFILVSLVLLLLLTSCSKQMTMAEFSRLPPFQGRVTKVEQIPYESNPKLRSDSAPDFRVTVVRDDGTTYVIKRIHTRIGLDDNLKNLLRRSVCTLPNDILKCEDRPNEE